MINTTILSNDTATSPDDKWYTKNDSAYSDYHVIHKSLHASPREGLQMVKALVDSTGAKGPDTTGKRRERKSVLPAEVWNEAMLNLELEAGIYLENREKESRGATQSNAQRIKATLTYYGTSAVIFNHGVNTKIRVRIRYYLTYLRDPTTNQPIDIQRAGVTLDKGFLELKVKSPRAHEENSVDKYRILVSDELIARLVNMDPRASSFASDLERLRHDTQTELDDSSKEAMVNAMFDVIGTEAKKAPAFIRPSLVITYERNAYKYIEKDYPLPILSKEDHPYHHKCLVQYLAKSLKHSFSRQNTSNSTKSNEEKEDHDCSLSTLFHRRKESSNGLRESTQIWQHTEMDHIGLVIPAESASASSGGISNPVDAKHRHHHFNPVGAVAKGVKKLFHHRSSSPDSLEHKEKDQKRVNHVATNDDSETVATASETTTGELTDKHESPTQKKQHHLDIEYQFTVDHNVKARYPLLPLPGETRMPVVEHFDPANATELMRYPANARVVEFKEPLVVATLPHKYQSVQHQALNDVLATRMQKEIMWGDYDANIGKYGNFRRRIMEEHHTNRIKNEMIALDFNGTETFWVDEENF